MASMQPIQRHLKEVDGELHLTIEDALSIYNAPELKALFIEGVENYKALKLDLKAVSDCDTAGLQLLAALRKTADKAGKSLIFQHVSQSIIHAFQSAGIDPARVLYSTSGEPAAEAAPPIFEDRDSMPEKVNGFESA
jgi:anti-sigma B factor antagonist